MTQLGAEAPPEVLATEAREATAQGGSHSNQSINTGSGTPAATVRQDWLRWLGVSLLIAQATAMLAWTTILWRSFALTLDYAFYHQAWWLIAHGHFNPFVDTFGMYFWQNHFELIMWPLALLGVLFPHGPVLLYLQDLAFVSAELIAWQWMCHTAHHLFTWQRRAILCAGLVALLADPWSWWAISFDFHMEVVGLAFVLAAAYELSHRGRRRAWAWVGLGLLCGAITATYIAGLGIATLLVSRQRWRRGLALLATGAGWTLVVTMVHGNQGATLGTLYGYLGAKHPTSNATIAKIASNILMHPLSVPAALWAQRVEIWANLGPSGVIGVFEPWALSLSLPVLLANNLTSGDLFSRPLFQSALLYVVVPVGTVLLIVWLSRRWKPLALALSAFVIANALGWAVVWFPQLQASWLRVPSQSASELDRATRMIPGNAEVVASAGIYGRFSDRQYVYSLPGPGGSVPVRTKQVWWVVAPAVGIEAVPVAASDAVVAMLAGQMHAQLVLHGAGIWVFRWVPDSYVRVVTMPTQTVSAVPAWSFGGATGVPVLSGPPSTWHLESDGKLGYVLDKDYWREPPGLYKATVTVASSVPIDVEVWNATGAVLLVRRQMPPTNGSEALSVIVNAYRHYRHRHYFTGWGPFRALFTPPPSDNQLEVRVWSPGGGVVDVQSVQLQPVR